MKLTNEILEKSREFYLDNHSLRETCEMVLGNYALFVSTSGLGKRLIQKGVNLRDRKEIARVFLRKELPEHTIKDITQRYTKQMHSIRKLSIL